MRKQAKAVTCPGCGSAMELHAADLITETGVRIGVSGSGDIRTDRDVSRAPRRERGAVSLKFMCEGCDDSWVLTFGMGLEAPAPVWDRSAD